MKNIDIQLGFSQLPSIEIFPTEDIFAKTKNIPKGTRVAVTCTSSKGEAYTLQTTIRLRKQGLNAYPHLLARLFMDAEEVKQMGLLLVKNGITDVFVAAGDIKDVKGDYSSSIQLLHTFKKQGIQFNSIAVTGYPEGHRYIEQQALLTALFQKQEFSQKTHTPMYIITQLCFDAETVVQWACTIREQGIHLPIIIGVSAPCDIVKLYHFALRCGVKQSVQFLQSKKHLGVGLATHSFLGYSPDSLISQIIAHPKFKNAHINGIHIYTFNEIAKTMRWLSNKQTKK